MKRQISIFLSIVMLISLFSGIILPQEAKAASSNPIRVYADGYYQNVGSYTEVMNEKVTLITSLWRSGSGIWAESIYADKKDQLNEKDFKSSSDNYTNVEGMFTKVYSNKTFSVPIGNPDLISALNKNEQIAIEISAAPISGNKSVTLNGMFGFPTTLNNMGDTVFKTGADGELIGCDENGKETNYFAKAVKHDDGNWYIDITLPLKVHLYNMKTLSLNDMLKEDIAVDIPIPQLGYGYIMFSMYPTGGLNNFRHPGTGKAVDNLPSTFWFADESQNNFEDWQSNIQDMPKGRIHPTMIAGSSGRLVSGLVPDNKVYLGGLDYEYGVDASQCKIGGQYNFAGGAAIGLFFDYSIRIRGYVEKEYKSPKVIASYVKLTGFDDDGNPIFETLLPSEEIKDADLILENGMLKLPTKRVIEGETGDYVAYMNDVLIPRAGVKLTGPAGGVEWNGALEGPAVKGLGGTTSLGPNGVELTYMALDDVNIRASALNILGLVPLNNLFQKVGTVALNKLYSAKNPEVTESMGNFNSILVAGEGFTHEEFIEMAGIDYQIADIVNTSDIKISKTGEYIYLTAEGEIKTEQKLEFALSTEAKENLSPTTQEKIENVLNNTKDYLGDDWFAEWEKTWNDSFEPFMDASELMGMDFSWAHSLAEIDYTEVNAMAVAATEHLTNVQTIDVGNFDNLTNSKKSNSARVSLFSIGQASAEQKSYASNSDSVETIHIRYVTVPLIMQRNRIHEIQDGKEVRVYELSTEAIIDKDEGATADLRMYDVSEEIQGATLNKWVVSDQNVEDLEHSPIPSSGSKSGDSIPETPITQVKKTDTLYADWDVNVLSEIPPAPPTPDETSNVVEQWRLSKRLETLTTNWGSSQMHMYLHPDRGHAGTIFSPTGVYNYNRINANGKVNNDSYTPANMLLSDWVHQATISKGTYFIGHNSTHKYVSTNSKINFIKSTPTASLVAASWINDSASQSELSQYNITSKTTPNAYVGTDKIGKSAMLSLGIRNKDVYSHWYSCRYHYYGCYCYLAYESPSPSYYDAYQGASTMLNRYVQQDTQSSKLAVTPSVTSENGYATLKYQLTDTIKVYPEYGMLFDNDNNQTSIKWIVGDQARLINPVVYQTMKFKAYVIPTVTGTAATDTRATTAARNLGLANLQTLYKGGSVNTTFKIQRAATDTVAPILTVKTFALDIKDGVKSAWGDASYNSEAQHKKLTDTLNGTKIDAVEKLLVDSPAYSSLDYTGAEKQQVLKAMQPLKYNGATVTTFL